MQEYEHHYSQITIYSEDEIVKFFNTDIIKKEVDKKAYYKLIYVDIRSEIHTYYYENEYDMQNEIETLKLHYNHGIYITYYREDTNCKWVYLKTMLYEGKKPDEDE